MGVVRVGQLYGRGQGWAVVWVWSGSGSCVGVVRVEHMMATIIPIVMYRMSSFFLTFQPKKGEKFLLCCLNLSLSPWFQNFPRNVSKDPSPPPQSQGGWESSVIDGME